MNTSTISRKILLHKLNLLKEEIKLAKSNSTERSCSICNKKYHYCNRGCKDYSHLPRWMDAYCSETCKEVYNICAGFVNNWLEPEVEAARLAELHLDDEYINKLSDDMKSIIRKIQKIDTKNSAAIMQVLKEDDTKADDKADTETSKSAEDEKKDDNKKQNNHPKIQYKHYKQNNTNKE